MKVHQLLPTFYLCRVQNHHHRHQPHQFRLRLHHQSTVMTWSYLDQSGRGRIQRSTPHLQRHLVYDATQQGRFEQQRTSVHSSKFHLPRYLVTKPSVAVSVCGSASFHFISKLTIGKKKLSGTHVCIRINCRKHYQYYWSLIRIHKMSNEKWGHVYLRLVFLMTVDWDSKWTDPDAVTETDC